jgi:hypothetical protein
MIMPPSCRTECREKPQRSNQLHESAVPVDDRAQHSYATTPLSSHCPEIVDSAMATAQGAIAHDHQVELSEVAGSGQ